MITLGVRVDTDDLPARIQQSIRRFGGGELTRTLEQLAIESNRRDALAGVDRFGRPLRPWRVRRGRSDYHGRRYEGYSDNTVLVPFGRASRRIDAFAVSIRRRSVAGFGFGAITMDAGFTARAGRIPTYWRAKGRDVLGMSPRTREGFQRLLTRHATYNHSLLKRAGAVGRVAAAIGL